MRIIAGERRGFRLEGPVDSSIRPTSDLRRDAIFNTLSGLIEDQVFHDLFSGTGAMALEALSRGAKSAVLVEMGSSLDLLAGTGVSGALPNPLLAPLFLDFLAFFCNSGRFRWILKNRGVNVEN